MKFCLNILKSRCQMKHRTAAMLYQLTNEMCLLWFQWVRGLCALLCLLSSILLLCAAKPYQCLNFSNQHFPSAVYLDATTSVLKCSRYSRGIRQLQMQYFKCKIQANSGHGRIDIYMAWWMAVILSFSLQRHFDRLNVKLNAFWRGLKLRTFKFMWQQSKLTHS